MAKKTIAGVELEVTNLEELSQTWGLDDSHRVKMLETAEKLVPPTTKFIEDEKDDGYSNLVLLAAKRDQEIILKGPKGTGKTTTIYHAANMTNNPLVPIQLNGATGVDTLIGRWLVNKEGTYWQDGLLTMARKYGFWVVLDEINMALPEVLAVLHPALDNRRILVLDEKDGEVIPRHPNCRIFASMNPTEDYAGTKEMNAALEDRITGMIEVDYPGARREREIILAHSAVKIDDRKPKVADYGIITRMVKVANDLRKLRKDQKMGFDCSPRNLIDWAIWCQDLPVKEAAKFAFYAKADAVDRKKISDEINKQFKDTERREPRKAGEVSSDADDTLDEEDDLMKDISSAVSF